MRILFAILLLTAPSLFAASNSDALIQFYQAHVRRDDTDFSNYDRLGSAYLQKAREAGDPTYYDLSEKAFSQALSLTGDTTADGAGVIAHLAGLDLAEHRFSEAHALAEKALRLRPDLLSVYAVLGDSCLETGDYAGAREAYAHLVLPRGSLPPRPGIDYLANIRRAGLQFIQGETRSAINSTRAAIEVSAEAGLPKENVAWSWFSLGELYFAIGDLTHADDAYQSALEAYPNYHRALAWMGQLRAAQGRYTEAAELYRRAIAVIPLPVYTAALGDIYERIGKHDLAAQQFAVVDLIARLSILNRNLFRRELAVYYADHRIHLDEALTLATEEKDARQDVYTWDAFAWISFQNGKIEAARDAVEHALAQGTEEPLFLFHAGMIYGKLGDSARAHGYFTRALALNPHFHINYADVARAH
jgi:tetratricopeptide (TPR) repeat protein